MKKIFVGNLAFSSTEDTVRALFENYGSVDRVTIMTDRETGRSRGFGFVEMPNEEEAERAIAGLNGRQVEGRALNVNVARPAPDRRGAGGGGGFGGGGNRGGGGGFGGKRREPRW